MPKPTSSAEPEGWPRYWLLMVVLSVYAMADWQSKPNWPMLVVASVATIGAVLLLHTVRRPRAWAFGTVLALMATVGTGIQETRTLAVIRGDSARWLEDD